jgi:hypothetical protein
LRKVKSIEVFSEKNPSGAEPPFVKAHRIISDKNTFQEMNLIIRASRFYELCALYEYSGKEFLIYNCIDVTDCTLPFKEYPFFDEENNIYLKTSDDKIVYLVIKHSPAGNFFCWIMHRLAEHLE